jgi:hypothetical protein
MMTVQKGWMGFALAIALAACSVYQPKPQMTYYHGQNVPEGYIQVVRASAVEVEFKIRVEFSQRHLYHLLLDGNEPLAEGWFPTNRMAGSEAYHVNLKLPEGKSLAPGKSYRLCIGTQNPQAVQMQSNNYRCLVDYTFVFQAHD